VLPAEITGVFWANKQQLGWATQLCATTFNVNRKTGPKLTDADANGLADDYGVCLQGGLATNQLIDADVPLANQTQFYVITGANPTGEGTMGYARSGLERPNLTPCP